VRHYQPDALPAIGAQQLIDAAQPPDVDPSLQLLLVQRDGAHLRRWLRSPQATEWKLLDAPREDQLPDQGLYYSQHTLDQAGQRIFVLGPGPGERAAEPLADYHRRVRSAGEWMGALWLSLSDHGLGGCPCGAISERELAAGLPDDSLSKHVLFGFAFGMAQPSASVPETSADEAKPS
jgi:hypothetical protein